MTVLMIIAFALFTLAALASMVRPFLQSRAKQARFDLLADELRQIEELVSLKSLYLDHLRELEIDHELSKIAEDDYQKIKRQTERAAVQVMRRLDAFHGGKQWQKDLDVVIAAHAQATPRALAPAADHNAPGTHTTPGSQAPQCPACHAVQTDEQAKFCSQCGATITSKAPQLRLLAPSLSSSSSSSVSP